MDCNDFQFFFCFVYGLQWFLSLFFCCNVFAPLTLLLVVSANLSANLSEKSR